MLILFATSTLTLAFWIIHIVLWKIRLPQRQTAALLTIYALVLAAWLLKGLISYNGIALIHVALSYTALAFSYIILYSGIEADSPTLSLMQFLANHSQNGVAAHELTGFLAARPFVQSRLDALMEGGLIKLSDGRYLLAGKGSIPFRFILTYRRIYGPIAKGG